MAVTNDKRAAGLSVRRTAYGWVAIAATRDGITLLTLPAPSEREAFDRAAGESGLDAGGTGDPAITDLLGRLGDDIVAYYAGQPVDFSGYRLDLAGTPFVQTVRDIVRAIPRGVVRSYGEVAALAGAAGAARAVGQVMAKNPVTVLIPCHRVVGSTNRLQGFGGGLPMKERMLKMEGVAFTAPGRVDR